MAESSTYLKEYLIQVGVQADTNTLSKFANIVGNIEKLVTSLTGAIAAGIIAIEGLVTITANELDDLYWATKRLKSSASDIQDFQLRIQKAGMSASDARAQLESLNQFRFANPFADQQLSLFGVDTRSNNDVKIMDSIITRMKQYNSQGIMGRQMALALGRAVGLSDEAIQKDIQQVGKLEDTYAKTYKKLGVNQKQATEDAHNYTNRLKEFEGELTVVSQTLGLKFLPVADKFLVWLTKSEAANDIEHGLVDLAKNIADIADAGARLFTSMPKEAQELGIVGFFLFGRKGLFIGALIGAADSLINKMAGGNKAIQSRQQEQLKTIQKNGDVIKKVWDPVAGFVKGLWNEVATPSMPGPQNFAKGSGANDLGNLIGQGEGGYNSVNLGKRGGYKSSSADLENMSVNDVEKAQTRGDFNAAGKYQLITKTVKDAAAFLKLSGHEKFNQKLQDRIFVEYLLKFKRKEIGDYLSGASNDLHAAVKAAAQEWASVADPDTGKSAYAGTANNKASISSAKIAHALESARMSVLAGNPNNSPPSAANAAANTLKSSPLGSSPAASKNVTINQTNTTTINNAKDPVGTGAQMKKTADRTNGDLVRNLSTALV